MAELLQNDVTITYIKTSGLQDVYTGTFYGETPDDCIDSARGFVIRYKRPASIISAVITPTAVI